jgi:hypothetical protein
MNRLWLPCVALAFEHDWKRGFRLAGVALATFLGVVTTLSHPAVATESPERYAAEIIGLSHWPQPEGSSHARTGAHAAVLASGREELVPGVAHYWFDLKIGSGTYDVLRMHRVVEERRPYVPVRSPDGIFLLHGDGFGFLKFIFGGVTPYVPADASLAVHLAQAGWDVWGIDQPWIHVPAEETDFAFAKDWGMQYQIDRLDQGIAVARATRFLTGNGWHKMKLLGYSSGGYATYAFMNRETQRPLGLRSVDGFVIADGLAKYDRSDPVLEASRQADCLSAQGFRDLVNGGTYMGDLRIYSLIGELAYSAPDDPSPFFEGLTNLQGAIVVGSVPDPAGSIPWYHFFAPLYEEGVPIPVGLRFTQVGAFVDFARRFVPYEPNSFFADYSDLVCDEMDVPWDDHLSEITAPMLLLAPRGGLGRAGHYTLGLLGSTDKTIADISFYPPDELDFGHIDLWLADIAPSLVWPTLIEWLDDHSAGSGAIAAREEVPDRETLRVEPNPGRAPHTFSFALPQAGEAALDVFDVAGRRVATLRSGPAAAGMFRVVWDGRDAGGRPVADGVYFARVRTPEGTSTSRFVHRSR